MAHMQKLKRTQTGAVINHCDRRSGESVKRKNKNIDASRTHLNYRIGIADGADPQEVLNRRLEEIAINHETSRTNVAASWVVTRPADLPDAVTNEEFFAAVYDFIANRYGEENMIGGFVHLDESTPHMHTMFVPVANETLAASKVVNRKDLQTYHDDLAEHLQVELGIDKSLIVLPKDERDRVANLSLDDYMREMEVKKNTVIEEQNEALKQERKKLEGEVDYLKLSQEINDRRAVVLKDRVASAEALVQTAESRYANINAELQTAKQALQNIYAELNAASEQKDDLAGEIVDLAKQIADLKAQKLNLTKDVGQLREYLNQPEGERYKAYVNIAQAYDGLRKVAEEQEKVMSFLELFGHEYFNWDPQTYEQETILEGIMRSTGVDLTPKRPDKPIRNNNGAR